MVDLKNKVFLDTDGEMTFENKERVNFIMHFTRIGAHFSTLETANSVFVHEDTETSFKEIWLPCAEQKQSEIDSLKAQLAKLESGEFVMVPKENLHEIRDMAMDAKYASMNNDNDRIFSDIEDAQMRIEAMIEAAQGDGDE